MPICQSGIGQVSCAGKRKPRNIANLFRGGIPMCAKAHFLRTLLLSCLATALSCSGCAGPLSHLWTKPESKMIEAPSTLDEQVWDKSASNETLETDMPEPDNPFEPEPGARYRWIVNDDYSFQPQNISARVVARDTVLVVEYTALTALMIVGFFCGHGYCLSGCSCPWSMPSSTSP